MLRSQNGYVANNPSLTATYTVPGTRTQLRLRKGVCAEALLIVAERFDNEVEDIDTAHSFLADAAPSVPGGEPSSLRDDWSYAPRPVRGQITVLSNHASGTACFSGDTEIVTREGIRPIADLAGMDVEVLTRDPWTGKNGHWRKAPIRSFGSARTYVITLARHGRKVQIRATADHRWFVRRPTAVKY